MIIGGNNSNTTSGATGDYDFTAAASVLGGIGMGFIEAAAGGTGTGDMSSSGAFEEGILVKLFEGSILQWATRRDKIDIISRRPVAILCLKLFLLVNVSNRALKVESDGSWVRIGQLSGLSLLWRLAVDATDQRVAGMSTRYHPHLDPYSNPTQLFKTNPEIILTICDIFLYLTCLNLLYPSPSSSPFLLQP